MRHLLIAGVMVVTSTITAAAQAPKLDVSQAPINLTILTKAQLEEALTTVGRLAAITIEFDATVTEAMRRAPLAETITVRGATFEQTLDVIASTNGLTYTVTGPRAIRLSKKV